MDFRPRGEVVMRLDRPLPCQPFEELVFTTSYEVDYEGIRLALFLPPT